MSEEQNEGQSNKQEDGKQVSSSIPPELEKKVKIYEKLDEVYRSAPQEAREKIDQFFKGNYDIFATKHNEEVVKDEKRNQDPLARLENELSLMKKEKEELAKKIDGIGNAYRYDQLSSNRNGINQKYEETFSQLAEEKGYKYGTEAYDSLFDSAIKAGHNLARKYGLVNEFGNSDPLLDFKPDLLKEAFDQAYDKHKRMGYDISEQRRKEAMKERENKRKAEEDELSPFLKKENLKTQEGRAKALKEMIRHRLRKMGSSLDDFKMV